MDLVKPIDSIWNFRHKKIDILKMDKKQVLIAALHCTKKLHNYNKFEAKCTYKIVCSSGSQLNYWKKKKAIASQNINLFATKLEFLDSRAEELGFVISDSFDELKKQIDLVEKITN